MRKLILAAAIFLFPLLSQAAASKDQVKLVEYFLKTPTKNLNPDMVPAFLSVGSQNLPKKLREKYTAKVMELYSLRKTAEGKKEGFIRTPDDSSPQCREFRVKKGLRMYSSVFPKDLIKGKSVPEIMRMLRLGHFARLSGQYMPCLQKKTQCTEQDMVCGFTLNILSAKKGKGRRNYYFIYENDPLGVAYSLCERPGVGKNTHFFGEKPSVLCSH